MLDFNSAVFLGLVLLISAQFLPSQPSALPTAAVQPFVSFNQSCNSSLPCEPNTLLTCTAGLCQCESPTNQIFRSSSNICEGTVGGQCRLEAGPEVQDRPCIKNAQCISFGGNYTECQCREGYIENASGHCVPGIGQPCSYRPEDCNPLGMIVCKNSFCQCYDRLQVYDTEVKRCVSPAGTHCKYDSLQLGCVKHAICYPFFYWIPARCLCKPGYVQTRSRTCVSEAPEMARRGVTEDL